MGGDFIINAYSSHSGGGRSGLTGLLNALPDNSKVLVFIDSRMLLPANLPPTIQFERVAPTLFARLLAERKILKASRSFRWLLRLGSLPPLFRLPIPSFVYFENRHLLRGEPIAGMPLLRKFRVHLERLWIRCFQHNATYFVVQTPSVFEALKQTLKAQAKILTCAFHEPHFMAKGVPVIDFIYVSSGDAHKNHKNLIDAWCWLAQREVRPSLAITVAEGSHPELVEYLSAKVRHHSLNVRNLGQLSAHDVTKHCTTAKAAIFPSTCESLGLPIVEAMGLGLPILASERDYVRDLLDPAETFDPLSAKSIGRAVLRHLKHKDEKAAVVSPKEFIASLQKLI